MEPADDADATRDLDEDDHSRVLPDPDSPQIGDTIGEQYEVCGVLGSGGMGTVYLARDLQLDREVAVKLIHADKVAKDGMLESFLTEARAMAKVNHANVVTIHAFGESDGRPYFVMEYVEGPNLTVWRQSHPVLTPEQAVEILDPLCLAVDAIHRAGALHRDLKPSNVLMGPCQRVAVTDFGLARPVTSPGPTNELGDFSGTPAYLAPETARREDPTAEVASRLDVYSLGVIAFELLTGELPFSAPSVPAMLLHHAYSVPPFASQRRPGLSPKFDAVLQHALAKSPEERTGTPADFRRSLIDALNRSSTSPVSLKVLVVDDDPSSLLAVREILTMAFPGVEVVTVIDAASATTLALNDPPDLVITDLRMPHGGGLALTHALRGSPETKDIPIIVITGHGGASDWRRLRDLGANRFLLKPIDIDTLAGMVHSLTKRPAALAD